MSDDQMSITKDLPNHLSERVRDLSRLAFKDDGEFVLYWMHHAVRGHENPALDTAVFVAGRLGLPVLVYQGLGGRHPYNSDRHHTFIMEGARDVQQELAHRSITYHFYLARDPGSPTPLKELTARAALILTEDFPAPPFTAWSRRLAASSRAAFWTVDTACILPMPVLKKSYARAYQFRKDTWGEFKKRMTRRYEDPETVVQRFQGRLGFDPVDLVSADIAELCASCRIDHTVGPVPHTRGGATAGYHRWEQFKRHGMQNYARTRNDAAVAFPSGVSRMSAYLHHGQVSPFRIARETAASNAEGAEKFLDEMLIWRELAHNFCFYHRHPATFDALPAWAAKTLKDHRQDLRRSVYTWEQMARATTGDPLWDAAQKSLLIHGELHNNLRMTWGKAILQWTRSPEEALQIMIDLNHRYALDGNDPNSYGGILWCLGLFDRPFQPEKPVIGTLRPRSTRSHAARLDLRKYSVKIARPAISAPVRVAVIGAGLSGLVAARTLADHGLRVQVFEKARAPGGRMSTRRMNSFAFDHGAQYFTVGDERFQKFVDSWIQAGLVRRWDGRIRVVHGGEIRKERGEHLRFVGVPGMSAVTRHLADALNIRWSTRAQHVRNEGRGIVLADEHGDSLGSYDALIVSAPPEQSAELLAKLTPLVDQATAVRMAPCWAVMLAFGQPLELPFDGAFIHDTAVVWAARNSSKPGRGANECWVLHADSAWSFDHFDLAPEEVVHRLTASFFSAVDSLPVEPVFAAAHRWRYAKAQNPLDDGCLWDRQAMIGLCGDWCCNSRIEGAFLSGAAMAGRVLGAVEPRQ
ncbi:MAG: FAD-dependent oxidoreductase [Desulfobacterales bacterium]